MQLIFEYLGECALSPPGPNCSVTPYVTPETELHSQAPGFLVKQTLLKTRAQRCGVYYVVLETS